MQPKSAGRVWKALWMTTGQNDARWDGEDATRGRASASEKIKVSEMMEGKEEPREMPAPSGVLERLLFDKRMQNGFLNGRRERESKRKQVLLFARRYHRFRMLTRIWPKQKRDAAGQLQQENHDPSWDTDHGETKHTIQTLIQVQAQMRSPRWHKKNHKTTLKPG